MPMSGPSRAQISAQLEHPPRALKSQVGWGAWENYKEGGVETSWLEEHPENAQAIFVGMGM